MPETVYYWTGKGIGGIRDSGVYPEDGRLVHPVLATVGAVFAWWRGDVVFHGGAVVIGDGAWGLLGERGTGKSSLLAGLARGA